MGGRIRFVMATATSRYIKLMSFWICAKFYVFFFTAEKFTLGLLIEFLYRKKISILHVKFYDMFM